MYPQGSNIVFFKIYFFLIYHSNRWSRRNIVLDHRFARRGVALLYGTMALWQTYNCSWWSTRWGWPHGRWCLWPPPDEKQSPPRIIYSVLVIWVGPRSARRQVQHLSRWLIEQLINNDFSYFVLIFKKTLFFGTFRYYVYYIYNVYFICTIIFTNILDKC